MLKSRDAYSDEAIATSGLRAIYGLSNLCEVNAFKLFGTVNLKQVVIPSVSHQVSVHLAWLFLIRTTSFFPYLKMMTQCIQQLQGNIVHAKLMEELTQIPNWLDP
jgi:hypothetical protein